MSAPSNGSPEGFARFENQNGGEVEMGNGNPVGVVETGVSFKDLRNPSKDTQDSDMDEDKVRLENYESFFKGSNQVSISYLCLPYTWGHCENCSSRK